MLYRIDQTRMLWGAKNSLPLGKKPHSLPIELLIFLLVSTIASVPQSLLISIVSVGLMLADPKYYELAMSDEISNEAITKYTEEFLMSLPDWIFAVSLFGCIFMILAAIIYCKKFEKRKAYTFGFAKRGFAIEYLSGMILGAVMIALPVLFCFITGCVTFSFGNSTPLMIGIYFLAFLVQGMGEEVMFRGYLLTTVARKSNVWVAVIISSLTFAIFHSGNANFNLIGFINIALFGFFAAIYVLRRGSIWGISAIHAIWNFAQGNIFGFNVSGTPLSDSVFVANQNNFGKILSGGEFGLEGGLGATIVLLVATLLVLVSPTKKSELVIEDDENEEIKF